MSNLGYCQPEPTSRCLPEKRPTFQDIEQNAEAGIIKRGIARYLFSRNPERSIKLHTYLGAQVTRAVIMRTYGKYVPRVGHGNYRTDSSKSRLEGATRFALGGSVFNEIVHTAGMAWGSVEMVNNIAYGHNFLLNVFGISLNGTLVSLQRYNRSRMVIRVNEELKAGATYRDDYENYLGIDHRAVENYEETIPANMLDATIPDLESGIFDVGILGTAEFHTNVVEYKTVY